MPQWHCAEVTTNARSWIVLLYVVHRESVVAATDRFYKSVVNVKSFFVSTAVVEYAGRIFGIFSSRVLFDSVR